MKSFLSDSRTILCLALIFVYSKAFAEGTTFTFVNKCADTVWPGILSNAGSPRPETTGFELPAAASTSFQAPTAWSGRFWARTGCSPPGDDSAAAGAWSCATGDCGTGQVECNGNGATPPATLAEFTLAPSSAGKDFYDVSLVDGYNLPMVIEASGRGGGGCAAAGCVTDVNRRCPAELRVGEGEGEACRSACEAFGKAEYCCSGAYASPAVCRPSVYSEIFKAACPRSYSYAFDDPTSTFTCSGGADYTITFCPGSGPSQKKSATDSSSSSTTPNSTSSSSSSSNPTSPTSDGGAVLDDDSWLAAMTGGGATATDVPFLRHFLFIVSFILVSIL